MAGQRRLTKRQQERVGRIQEKRRQRLEPGALLEPASEEAQEVQGEVVVRHGSHFVVEDGAGALYHCRSRSNLGHLVCGDRVVWQVIEASEGIITALLPRDTLLARPDFAGREKPLAANIDQLIIVIAPEPEPSEYLMDQYLVAAAVMGVEASIAVNKIDLAGDQPEVFLARFAHYRDVGYALMGISATQDQGLNPLIERLRGGTAILVGQSGVGKSSLINALLPDREVQVGRLSAATGLGRHTTSAATCYRLPGGGRIIDSPGVRSFRLADLDRQRLEQGFREFAPFIGQCRFADCSHQQEPECALKNAVQQGKIHPARLANFVHMMGKATERH